MKAMNKVCLRKVEYKDEFGNKVLGDCENKIKYEATYIKGTTGKEFTEKVCGIHLNSLKKIEARLVDKMGFEMKLKYRSI